MSATAAVIPIISHQQPAELAWDLVSKLGDHTLYRAAESEYILTGPNPDYSIAWLMAALPSEDDGEWWTEWLAGPPFRMRVTR